MARPLITVSHIPCTARRRARRQAHSWGKDVIIYRSPTLIKHKAAIPGKSLPTKVRRYIEVPNHVQWKRLAQSRNWVPVCLITPEGKFFPAK